MQGEPRTVYSKNQSRANGGDAPVVIKLHSTMLHLNKLQADKAITIDGKRY